MRNVAKWLSLILVFTIPWENAVNLGAVGTLTRGIGVLAAVVWLVSALSARRVRRLHPFHIAIFLFVLWNISSFYWSVAADETVERIKTYIQLAVLVCIFWDLYTMPLAFRAALQAFVLGAYVTIGSTIFNFLTGKEISTYEQGRFAGAQLNAVDLALILALGLPIAWHLATSVNNNPRNHYLKLLNYGYIPASVFAILLSGTRTGLFLVVPAIFYILGTMRRLRPLYRVLVSGSLLGGLLVFLSRIPKETVDRLSTTGDSIAQGHLGGRVELWVKSMAIFSEHPLLGIGSGALHADSQLGTVAHNTFLSISAELGLIGFILFSTILGIVLAQTFKQPKWTRSLWLTVLLIWGMGVSTLTWEFRKPTWLFLSLVVISAGMWGESNQTRWLSKIPDKSKMDRGGRKTEPKKLLLPNYQGR